jgi:DNA-binding IclR family transcriptional regulator
VARESRSSSRNTGYGQKVAKRKVAGSNEGRSSDIAVLQRVSRIFDTFSSIHPERTVAEVGRTLSLPTSTVHRILSSLVTVGLLERPSRGRYRLGIRLHELGQSAVFAIDLRERALQHLETLRAEVGQTIQLGILSGTDVVYIHRLEEPLVFTRFVRSGQRVPAYASSSGKVLLAFGESDGILDDIARHGYVRRAPRTITSTARLIDELAGVRARGYAESIEETWPNMASVAVPVLNSAGHAAAAISVAGSLERFDDRARSRAARLAMKASSRLSADLRSRP